MKKQEASHVCGCNSANRVDTSCALKPKQKNTEGREDREMVKILRSNANALVDIKMCTMDVLPVALASDNSSIPRTRADTFQSIARSRNFRAFARAFREATGLFLALVPVSQNGGSGRNAGGRDAELCPTLRRLPKGLPCCANCQRRTAQRAITARDLHSTKCLAGIVDVAVPIFSGGRPIATLMAGKVFHKRRRLEDWECVVNVTRKCGLRNPRQIWSCHKEVPVVPDTRFRAACVLLEFFARALEERIREWLVSGAADVPLSVKKATDCIRKRARGPVTLLEVARHAGLGVQHFCEVFKRHTGLTFTRYLALERVEYAKILLRNEAMQVAEAAFACGFESISSFNRAFKRLTGMAPTQYRFSLLKAKHARKYRQNH